MSGKSINFGDKKFDKSSFYKNKKIFNIDNINIKKILKNPLCIKLPQMIGYVKCF